MVTEVKNTTVKVPYGTEAYQELLKDEIPIEVLKSRIAFMRKQARGWLDRIKGDTNPMHIELANNQAKIYNKTADSMESLLPKEDREKPPDLAPHTSMQTGLAGLGKEAAQVEMFSESGGGKKESLIDVDKMKAIEAAKPLPGQSDMLAVPEPDADKAQETLELKQEYEAAINEHNAEIEGYKEVLNTSRLTKLLPVYDRIQRKKDQPTDVTLKEYRKITGSKEPRHPIVKNGKTYVSWDETLDQVVTEYGVDTPEELYNELQKVADARDEIKSLKIMLRNDTDDLKKVKQIIKERHYGINARTNAEVAGGKGEEAKREAGKTRPDIENRRTERQQARNSRIAELRQIQSERSLQSQIMDVSQKHSVVISPYSDKAVDWTINPGQMDIQGIDTPNRARLKELKFKRPKPPKQRKPKGKVGISQRYGPYFVKRGRVSRRPIK